MIVRYRCSNLRVMVRYDYYLQVSHYTYVTIRSADCQVTRINGIIQGYLCRNDSNLKIYATIDCLFIKAIIHFQHHTIGRLNINHPHPQDIPSNFVISGCFDRG